MTQPILPMPITGASIRKYLLMVFILLGGLFHSLSYGATPAPAHKQVFFVEDNVPDYHQLSPANMDVVVLDSKKDGLTQIAAALQQRRDIGALHIVSHGGPASLQLGALQLDRAALGARSAELGAIRAALRQDGEILLYGCNVAQGQAGQDFIGDLAARTGASVAASTGLTGAASLGGNWILEHRSAPLRTAALSYPAYRQVLQSVAGTVDPGPRPDFYAYGPTFTDDEGTFDVPGIVYELYFSNDQSTPAGSMVAITNGGGLGTVVTNPNANYSSAIIRSQGGQTFKLSSFVMQDAEGTNATYTATGYRNNVAVGTQQFTIVQSGSFSTIVNLNTGFQYIDKVIITAAGGTANGNFFNHGFNSLVFADPVIPSNNADLSNLTLSNGSLAPAFAAGTISYTATVPFATGSITVTPTVADAGATVKVNGVAVTSGSPSGAIALGVGSANVITTVVTAADNSTKTYTTTVTRNAASGNNQLGSLAISSGTLAPTFASGTQSYTASVSNATTSVTLTPTVSDPTATVTVNGVATTSGNASAPLGLSVGNTALTVVVTAQNGTPLTYTVTVTRGGSANASLSALALSSGTLSPGFASGTTSYTASVSNATTAITVTPTVADANASVTVNTAPVASGNASGAIPLFVGSNTITTVVTAQDGVTTSTYTVTVTRAASSNNNLSALSLSSGTLNPVFGAATTSYTASIAAGVGSITVTPTTAVSSASITVNGNPVSSGVASGAIAMNPGSNAVTVVVTAQNGAPKTYTVTVTRALPSANADLSALSLSSGTLSPAFAAGTTSYTASVSNATASITVTPTVADATATVTVNGVAVTSGNASGAIGLTVGTNPISVVVTAENGTTIKSYTVTVTRAGSGDANLSALVLSGGSLMPAFASATTSYTMSIAASSSSITVTPTVSQANATVTVNGTAVASGSASAALPMITGGNTVTVVVTAQNSSTKTYTVTVTRAVSTNNDLSALALSSGTLNPVFSAAQQTYTASVPFAASSITVTPTMADASASITVNGVATASGAASGAINLNVGANLIQVVVTAQDGSPRTYNVTVTRASSNDATLSALALSSGSLTPVFSAAQGNYTATVPFATSTLTLTPTVATAGATIKVNTVATASGAASAPINLALGANTITVDVTAPDGVTTGSYTVVVTRQGSANADLASLSVSAGSLTPAFGAATTTYGLALPFSTSSINVTPTVAEANASVTVNGVPVASGASSGAIAVAPGASTVLVSVTAQSGAVKTYTINVSRTAASGNADLAGLAVTGGSLSPAFAPGATAYSISLPFGAGSISLTPSVADSAASVTVNNVAVASGASSAPIAIPAGVTSIAVSVTAQDGTVKTYTITVSRAAASSNADLGGLSLSGGSLAPAFAPNTLAYSVSVPNAMASVSVTPSAADSAASVRVNGALLAGGAASAPIALTAGVATTITVQVSAQDGTLKTYSVTVTREASGNAALGGLVLSGGALSPGFSSGVTSYAIEVPNTTTSLSVTPTVADGTASVTVNGVAVNSAGASAPIALAVGANTVTIVVKAQNGALVTTTITVTRAAAAATASLAGAVYTDANHNGVKEPGEIGLAGVTLNLTGVDAGGAAVALSTVSGADGGYTFTALRGGTYALTEVHPANTADGKESAGSAGGTVDNSAFDDSAAHNRIANIVLADGQAATGYLFGEQLSGSLQGFVYVDSNGNGVKDGAETGLAGVRVSLALPNTAPNAASRSVTSGADGSFAFGGLTTGTYTLSRNPADADGNQYADGRERAGAAGGTVNNASFGTQAYQTSISAIAVDGAALAATGGKLDGYLFGLRPRGVAGIKLPIVSGAIMLSSKPTPGHSGGGLLAGWTISLSQNGKAICSVLSNAQGQYQIDNLACPGYEQSGLPTGSGFALQFNKAGSNLAGMPESGGDAGTEAYKTIGNITLSATDEITQQNLPLDPEGIVYDAVSRQPLAGVTVTISGPPGFDPATHLVGGAVVQNQVTGNDGVYQYLLQNGYPTGVYTLAIAKAPVGYGTVSALLPACSGTLNVGAAPDPAFIQASETAPAANAARHDPAACSGLVAGGAASTQYYMKLLITNGVSAPILNNHIPLDAAVASGLALSKSGDRQTVELGDTVRYTIVLNQGAGSTISQAAVRDVLPAGFRFIPGTVTVNGVRAADPVLGAGSVLGFKLGGAAGGKQLVLTYRVRVGVGSMQGDGVNRARAYACAGTGASAGATGCLDQATLAPLAGAIASNEASFRVQVTGGVFTTDACVAGKVYTDCNRNGMQDAGEAGIPGVRLYIEDGTNFTTDADGKYSFCGLSPTSHVIKVDPTTLPAGSVLGETSNRNLGDADSLLLDVKNGELIRADFAETSCAAPVQERIKLLRAPGAGAAQAPPPTGGSPGITFSSKVKGSMDSKVNRNNAGKLPANVDAKGEQHAR